MKVFSRYVKGETAVSYLIKRVHRSIAGEILADRTHGLLLQKENFFLSFFPLQLYLGSSLPEIARYNTKSLKAPKQTYTALKFRTKSID